MSLLSIVAFFISFSSAQPSYQISFSAQEISGASSNLGFIFIDGVQYNLSVQLSMTEGYYSILYYSEDDFTFSEWDSDGLVVGSTSENENIVHITRSGSIRALYKKGPELDVNIVHPKNNDEVNGSIVTLSVLISHLNTPIHYANVSFYIDEIYIGDSLSDSQGIALFDHPINPFIQYTFKASAKKREYVSGSSNSVVFKRLDEYRYSLMTNNEEDIFTSNIYLQAHFRINNVPAANVACSFYLDGNYLGTTNSETNGWSSIRIDDIPFGNHSWYVIFSKDDKFSVQSDLISFFNYGEIIVEIFPSLLVDINFNEDHIIILNTKVLSNGYPIFGIDVLYFINNTLFGTKITNRDGISSFKYEFQDINEQVVWFSNIVINNEVEKKSELLSIYSIDYIKPLQITPIYPVSDTTIHPYTQNIQLTCRALINEVPVEDVSIYFYVNSSYIGFNYTDKSGLATFIFSPQLDGHTYEWFVVGSKKNSYLNETMKSSSFYQTIKPQDIRIINSYVSDDRTDINTIEVVSFQLIWDNGSYVKNRLVTVTGDVTGLTNQTGWASFDVTESNVSKMLYKVNAIQGEGVNQIHNQNTTFIIWDMIVINISTANNRINVGSTLEPMVVAFYDYDKSSFEGEYVYNALLYNNEIEFKDIYIKSVVDELYNITTFSSNVINVCWDMIVFYTMDVNKRYQVSETLDLELNGYYSSDNTSFKGTYAINQNLTDLNIGLTKSLNLTISDHKYGLSKYAIVNDEIMLDRIDVKKIQASKYPGKMIISIIPTFQSDNSIVNASITINQKEITYYPEEYVYKFTSPAFFLLKTYYLRVEFDNFDDFRLAFTVIHYENIFCLISFSMFSFSVVSVILRLSPHPKFGNKWRYLKYSIQKLYK